MRIVCAIGVVSVVVLTGGRADASPIVLDQFSFVTGSNLSAGNGFFNAPLNGVKDLAQTFVVANTGILTEIVVGLSPQGGFTGDLLFDIVPLVGDTPSDNIGTALVSRVIPRADVNCIPTCNQSILSIANLGLAVTAGDHFAIVLRAALDGAFTWDDAGFPYAGGQGFSRGFNGAWSPIPDGPPGVVRDLAFQTFVDCADPSRCTDLAPPRPVPEPSTMLLIGAGGAALILRRKQARRTGPVCDLS